MKAETKESLRERIAFLEATQESIESGEVPTVFGMRLDEIGEIYDPYGVGNARPFSFKKHPKGFQLRWCREESRNDRGWKGWEAVSWEDKVGKNINDYCYDPPRKLDNKIDSKVRRGDALLCILPAGMWVQRQLERTRKANQAVAEHVTPEENIIEQYKKGGVFGPGLTESERPIGGFKMKPEEVSERSVRAHGLLNDAKAGHNVDEDDGE